MSIVGEQLMLEHQVKGTCMATHTWYHQHTLYCGSTCNVQTQTPCQLDMLQLHTLSYLGSVSYYTQIVLDWVLHKLIKG